MRSLNVYCVFRSCFGVFGVRMVLHGDPVCTFELWRIIVLLWKSCWRLSGFGRSGLAYWTSAVGDFQRALSPNQHSALYSTLQVPESPWPHLLSSILKWVFLLEVVYMFKLIEQMPSHNTSLAHSARCIFFQEISTCKSVLIKQKSTSRRSYQTCDGVPSTWSAMDVPHNASFRRNKSICSISFVPKDFPKSSWNGESYATFAL